MKALWSLGGIAAFVCVAALAQQSTSQSGVSGSQAESRAGGMASGMGLGTPSFGSDPCQRRGGGFSGAGPGAGGLIRVPDIGGLTGMPDKPVTSLGRGGLMDEGEGGGAPAESGSPTTKENVAITDNAGNQVGTQTYDAKTNTTTWEVNTSDEGAVFSLNDGTKVVIGPNTKATSTDVGGSKDGTKISKAEVLVGRAWNALKQALAPGNTPVQTKTAPGGVRGNCDPEGLTGGCTVSKGEARIYGPNIDLDKALADVRAQGLVTKARLSRINPGPEGNSPSSGPKPAQTYPGQAIHTGMGREIAGRSQRGGQITNPKDDTGGGTVGDFCGNHFWSVGEVTAQKIDPSHIINPGDQRLDGWQATLTADKTLIWSKTQTGPDGSRVMVQKGMRNGRLVSLSYTFTDRSGRTTGTITYSAATGRLEGRRLR